MKLKRLIVHGFKSFKDKTIIHFDEGITGIVGPNGCGKSNIVDALFWVMGEQSAKHLRGTSMKDVIFSGSVKYSPASWAEVSLVLENENGKHIHIGEKVLRPQEIQLTRKLYRNGETEYRINNVPARLKDIHEVFMDTGAGTKSYSIIAQGEINRLVQARPQERRVMVEEVAGITKFKLRKKESLKKIEQTQSNLHRLTDLKTEIHKNLKQLESQAEKAEKARSLKQKIEHNELILFSQKEYNYLKDFREYNQIFHSNLLEVESLYTKKNAVELGLEQEKARKLDLMEKVEKRQNEFNEISRKLATFEERLNHLQRSKKEKSGLIESRRKENGELEQELVNRKERLESLKADLSQLESEQSEGISFDDLEERVEILKENIEMKEQKVADDKSEISKEQAELKNLEHEWLRNTSKAEELAKNLEEVTLEIEKMEKEYSSISQELNSRKLKKEEIQKMFDGLSERISELKSEQTVSEGECKTIEREFGEKSREFIQIESRISSLKEVQTSGSHDYLGNTEFIKENKDWQIPILGNILECDDIYALGVQNLFNEYLQSIILPDDFEGNVFDWFLHHKKASMELAFFRGELGLTGSSTDSETMEILRSIGATNVVACSEIVRINRHELSEGIQEFLRGTFILDNLDKDLIDKLPSNVPICGLASPDGKKILHKHNGVFILKLIGGESKAQGQIQRNNLITKLSEEFDKLKLEKENLENKRDQLRQLLEAKKNEYEDATSRFSDIKSELASHRSFIESKESHYLNFNNKLEQLKSRKIEISKSRLKLLESEEKLSSTIEEMKDKLSERLDVLEEYQEELNVLKEQFSEEKEGLIKLQTEAKSFAVRMTSITSQINDVQDQIKRQEVKKEGNLQLIQDYTVEVNDMAQTIEELENSIKVTAEELSQRDMDLAMIKEGLNIVMTAMEGREKEIQSMGQRIGVLEKDMALKKVKLEQIIADEDQCIRNSLEKYKMNLREVIGKYLSFSDEELQAFSDISRILDEVLLSSNEGNSEGEERHELKRDFNFTKRTEKEVNEIASKVKKFKSELTALGEINWSAVDDYERQKKRYDFLQKQEDELKHSLVDLNNAIMHIDEKSKKKFALAYDEVNSYFERVFPILFGGGSAKLELVGNIDDPECGIDIIAQPPGKKMQNINLMSGGEKAMTAVSLIFSIFLVKPSPFCLLDEVDAPLDDANVTRFNTLLKEMSQKSQFILITHNKKTMELNDVLYGVTMQEPGVSKAVSIQLQ